MKNPTKTVQPVKPRNWTVVALRSGMFRSKVERNKKREAKHQPF